MPQPQFGILLPAPVRVNNTDDNYPIAVSIDIQGGLHNVKTIDERNAIKEGRREWGMLCTVYDDPNSDNNGTYQLVYNASNNIITNNLNWRKFSGSTPPPITNTTIISGEWLSSVSTIISTPGATPSDGTRFLISSPSFAAFSSESHKIAEWDVDAASGSGGWIFTTPTNGATIRVDDQPNLIYKFSGTLSEGGFWQKEYLSQVRYIQPTSSNGETYSFTTPTGFVPLDAYSYSVFYANFGRTNSGTCSLQIDNLGFFPIKKLNSGLLLDLSNQDLVPNVQYHLSWNNGSFQVLNLGGVAGASAGIIGPAEDQNGYADGLFTDFTPSTPIGVPIDRFNEILLALVPPPAPDLSSWSLGGPSFVNGKLSFDNTIPGLSAAPNVGINGDFIQSGFRKGINSFFNQPNTDLYYKDYVGTLNSNTPTGPGTPTPAYPANSFGNGITGSLVLRLNGATISNESLSNRTSINTTSGGTQSGLIISAATSSKFPSGVPFETFWHRTGQYLIKKDDPRLRRGFNFLDLSHVLPSQTLTLASYSWVSDSSTFSTSFTSNSISSISGGNPKTLSGIRFWTTLSLSYNITLTNHVSNTYNSSTDAVKSYTQISGIANGINGKTTTTNQPIMTAPLNRAIQPISSPSTSQSLVWQYTQLGTSVRRLNESISFRTEVSRTVQGVDTSSPTLLNNLFIDNYPQNSSLLVEEFLSETHRIRNGATKYSSDTDVIELILSDLSWGSTFSLNNSPGYDNGLQIINGQLVYPNFTYSNVGTSDTNPNFGLGSPVNYSLCKDTVSGFSTSSIPGFGTNYRTFTRYFRVNPNSNFAVLRFDFELSQTTFINSNLPLSDNNCWCEVKLPESNTVSDQPPAGLIENAVTGWLDLSKPAFDNQQFNGGGANRLNPNLVNPTSIEVDFRSGRSTVYSGGYILFRITAPSSWTGHISKITCTGLSN